MTIMNKRERNVRNWICLVLVMCMLLGQLPLGVTAIGTQEFSITGIQTGVYRPNNSDWYIILDTDIADFETAKEEFFSRELPARETPRPEVALACGSASSSRTFLPSRASEAARLMAVVVLPTPPFWFASAITFAILFSCSFAYGLYFYGASAQKRP